MPCRPRMAGCPATCGHKLIVSEYRAAREAAELAREAATAGYAAELAEYGPIVTFRDYLTQRAGQARTEEG